MDILSVVERFPDQEACIAHLEKLRWSEVGPFCPYCAGLHVRRKKENDRVGRWNCHDCHSSFNVLQGTIFHKTRIPLQKWFVAIALMINAKKSLSSCQLSRDLNLNQTSCWYMQYRIRTAMASDDRFLLKGIVEVDETYVGGKFRWKDEKTKRGRGTHKMPVIGAVERKGSVTAQVTETVSGYSVSKFINKVMDVSKSTLVTDQLRAYRVMDSVMDHFSVNHSERYVDGEVHTNTIEGFWAHLKRAWYGQHHHYSKAHMSLYVSEACWKYNRRREKPKDTFHHFLKSAVLLT